MDWKAWGSRRVGRGGPPREEAPPQQAAPPPPVLTQPPPGYAWAAHPQHGYILVPLVAPPSIAPPAPMRQPTGVLPYAPYAPSVAAVTEPTRTCELVRPGDRDTYAELLQQVPDLVPPTPYDATVGRPNPAVAQELSRFAEFRDIGMAPNPDAPTSAFPTEGKGVPVARAAELAPLGSN